MLFIILLTILLYAGIQTWFILGFLRNPTRTQREQPFLSVVVAAHNEEKTINDCIQALVNQQYPEEKYEIILVDDRSRDGTGSLIQSWAEHRSNIKVVRISSLPADRFGKKNALQAGIQASKGEILCFTDADSRPSSQWLARMAKHFHPDVGMVVGLSPLSPARQKHPPLWQRFAAYESWVIGFVSLAAINNNFPLTCTGRNLGYRARSFTNAGGFTAIAHSLSGDDDLLMHHLQRKNGKKIIAAADPEAIVQSETASTWRQFQRQKIRHLSAGKYYPIEKKLFYLCWHGAAIFLTFAPLLGLVVSRFVIHASLIALAGKWMFDFLFHWLGFRSYHQTRWLLFFPVFQMASPIFLLFTGPLAMIKKPVWN